MAHFLELLHLETVLLTKSQTIHAFSFLSLHKNMAEQLITQVKNPDEAPTMIDGKSFKLKRYRALCTHFVSWMICLIDNSSSHQDQTKTVILLSAFLLRFFPPGRCRPSAFKYRANHRLKRRQRISHKTSTAISTEGWFQVHSLNLVLGVRLIRSWKGAEQRNV